VLFILPGLLSQNAWGADLVPRLVRDLQPASYAGSSSPRQFASVSDGFVFTAFGRELWQYDRLEETFTSELRKDGMRQLDGSFYAALEPSGKWTLWSVSGFHFAFLRSLTATPLQSVGVAYREPTGAAPMLFDADGGAGRGLWTSDLFNQEGTVEIARPLPLADGKLLRDLIVFRHRAYFVARHRQLGTALWVTDGTKAGTYPVFVPPSQEGTPLSIVGIMNGRLLLAVPGPGAELWSSDGTRRGTRPLQEIVRGEGSAVIHDTAMAAGHAFLIVDDGRHGQELWVSDGTAAGARRLTDFAAADPFGPAGLPAATRGSTASLGPRLLFFADDGGDGSHGGHGNEPWWSDGTREGTERLADLCPGPCSSAGVALTPFRHFDTGQAEILFSAATPASGRELWRTDGTAAGTSLVSDICDGPCSSDPGDIQTSNGYSPATFTAAVSTGERALWMMNGTTGGSPEEPVRLTPPGVAVARGPRLPEAFAAADAEFGDELWRTGGTPETTRMWADLGRERESGSYPILLGAAGDRLIFTTYFPLDGRRLWSSDGTAAGTFPLPGRGPRLKDEGLVSVSAGGRMFLAGALHGGEGRALWAVNGTPGGTVRLTPPGVRAGFQLYSLGDRAVFDAEDLEHGSELWVSGGTPETTHLLIDLVPGPGDPGLGFTGKPVLLAGRLLFARSDSSVHLWLTDGTAEGTRPLLDFAPFLRPIEESGFYFGPTEFRGKVYFVIGYEERQILVSDGTAAGTRVWDFPGAPHGVIALYPGTSKMFLTVASEDPAAGPYGADLWVTDGTPEGTAPVPLPAGLSTLDTEPVVFRDQLLFSSGDIRYWVTDGFPNGTSPVREPDGKEISSFLGRATAFDGHLIFAAANGYGTCYDWTGDGPVATPIPGVLCGNAFLKVGSRLFFNGFEPHTGGELWVLEEK
jgi:ELWxxDGT repeat protein